MQIVPGRQH